MKTVEVLKEMQSVAELGNGQQDTTATSSSQQASHGRHTSERPFLLFNFFLGLCDKSGGRPNLSACP